jgi:4-amino-4-deoxy-L-arabinose transferase-like glycosyltransferase
MEVGMKERYDSRHTAKSLLMPSLIFLQLRKLKSIRTNPAKMVIKAVLVLIIFTSIAARFLYLEADFPQGLTWEGALYTDEGWYSNGAIAYSITGSWYVEGDYNLAFVVPIFTILQAIVFKILGLSLFSARSTVIMFYLLIILLSYLLVRKYINFLTALVTALLLSVNFTLFAYSRLGINIIPMVSIGFVSIFIVLYFPNKNYLIVGGIASITLFIAILTKTTAMLLLPVLLYAIYVRQIHVKKRVYACLWSFGVLSVCFLLYQWGRRGFYPEDHVYFSSRMSNALAIGSRFTLNVLFVLNNIPRAIWNGAFLDPLMYLLTITMVFFPVFLVVSKRYRENKVVGMCFIWIFSYLAILSLCKYQPPRYYLSLIIPITILFSTIVVSLYHSLKPSRWSYLPIVVLSLIVFTNASSITSYLWHPNYSFLTMTQDVQRRINQEPHRKPLLLGNLANSISLATGIPSINENEGTRDLKWKLSRYQPTHYISLGVNNKVIDIVEGSYTLEKLATYDVFGNYYRGKRVHLYKLTQKRNKY